MPQLDALRAFAALGVIYVHLGPFQLPPYMPLGLWGVELFFVLSGFLITGILMKSRDSGHSPLYELKQFYIRRGLRIFPLYYLIILGMFVIRHDTISDSFPWHVTYTSNIYIALIDRWPGSLSHLWSLSVEEQFYLIWPWLLLFLPSRAVAPAIISVILVAPIYRALGSYLGLHLITLQVLTPGALDALGLGALLGFWRHQDTPSFAALAHRPLYVWLGLPLLLAAIAIRLLPYSFLVIVLSNCCSATLFFWLIHQTAVGVRGYLGQALEFKPLLYLGRISYGLYLWHNFVPGMLVSLSRHFHLKIPTQPLIHFIVLLGVTIMMASCSWLLLERPMNNLKHRFSDS